MSAILSNDSFPERLRCPVCSALLPIRSARQICLRCALENLGDDLEPSVDIPTIGQQLAGYQLLEEIGRGATGVVFRARQAGLDREVAVKVLQLGPLAPAEENTRFRREAVAVARLRHPHIVPILEINEAAGWIFLVFDLIHGCSLAARLDEGWPTPRTAARWMRDAADALAHAHARGVIHRDLKPANILLDKKEQVYLTDFGLAKLLDLDGAVTGTSDFVGTIAYLAPEQAGAIRHPIGPCTDVYALGAILYHCLTGQPPFGRQDPASVLRAVAEEDPVNPQIRAPLVPKDLATICLKCLSKPPSDRYASAEELRDDLDRFLHDEPILARRVGLGERAVRWVRRNRVVTTLAVALVLSMATGLVLLNAARNREAMVASLNHNLLTRQYVARGFVSIEKGDWTSSLAWFSEAWQHENPLPFTPADDVHRLRLASTLARSPHLKGVFKTEENVPVLAVDPTGRRFVAGDRLGSISVWETETGVRLAGPWKFSYPVICLVWSPDGKRFAAGLGQIRGDGGVLMVDLQTHQERFVEQKQHPIRAIDFSRDGQFLATGSTSGECRVWSVPDMTPLGKPHYHADTISAMHFSPDGNRILVASWDGTASVWDWKNANRILEVNHEGYVRDAALSPDGRVFVTASADGTAQIWDSTTGKAMTPVLRHQSQVTAVSFSADGKQVATASNDGTARVWDVQTGASVLGPLVHSSAVRKILFSPDQTHLLTGTAGGSVGIWNLKVGAPEYFSLVLIPHIQSLAWVQNGKGFLTSDGSTLVRYYTLPEDTAHVKELLLEEEPNELALSPDGSTVLVALDSPTAVLWRWRDDGVKPLLLPSEGPVHDAGFTRDGTRCYTASKAGTARIWDVATGKPITRPMVQANPLYVGLFTIDGNILLTGDEKGEVRRWNAKTGQLLEPVWNYSGKVRQMACSPDGRYIAAAGDVINPATPSEESGRVRIWDAVTGAPCSPWIRRERFVNRLEFSPDSRLLLVGSRDGLASVYSVEKPETSIVELSHRSEVLSASFSPDGLRIVTGELSGVGHIWDAATGQLLHTIRSQHGRSFDWSSGDGRWVVSKGRDLGAQVWDVATLDPILPPMVHQDVIRGGILSSDNSLFVTMAPDRRVKVWSLEIPRQNREELRRQAALISNQSVSPEGVLETLSSEQYLQIWRQKP